MNVDQALIEVTTLGDLLLRAAARWPGHEALVFPDLRLSYAELASRARRRARALIAAGVQSGDHVGILAINMPEVVETLYAIALADGVAVVLNARYKTAELEYVIANADIKWLFTTARFAEHVDFPALLYGTYPRLREAAPNVAIRLDSAPLLGSIVLFEAGEMPGMISAELFEAGTQRVSEDELELRRSRVSLRNPCLMMYTSGTTSNPKGCRLSHEALVRNARGLNRRFEMRETDLMWDPLPMFHMSSVLPQIALTWSGGCYATDTHFKADRALAQIYAEQPTILFTAFPAIMADLLNHPEFDAARMPRLRLVNNVAPPDTLRANMRAIPQAVHVAAYGLTEASGISCHGSAAEDDEKRSRTSGRPYDGVQLRVVDPETGEELAAGERGEIQIKGFSLFEGYYKSPEHNARVFSADGWLRTGDLCSIDETGCVAFHGRIKDMLKIGGENVAALEIESFIGTHPAVQLVQVVGAPHPRLQEVAAAFIQLKQGASVTEQEIIDYCRGRIASFKVPRHVRFVEDWPMSTTKIQKFALRERIAAELLDAPG